MSLASSLELNTILEQVKTHCSFSLGKKRIEDLQPSFDKLVILQNNARMKEALQACIKYGPMPFAGIHDVTDLLQNAARGRVLTAQECLQELQFIRGVKGILVYEKSLNDLPHPSLQELTGSLVVHSALEKELARCFNEYGEVMDSASAELRGLRIARHRAEGAVADTANRFVSTHSDHVVDSIVTYKGGRAVILVKAQDKNLFGGLVYGDSASGAATYIEPAALVAANNKLQEFISRENEEVVRILRQCSALIGAASREELANVETCAILDEIFAKAIWGTKHDACAAVLSAEKVISLEKARHPLIDPEKVVANTYHLADPKKVLLITGPNTGGKTVSMKIIGLFTLMTYCGMPVTCESAVIPFFDQVFADIGDDQSVVSSLSSFSAHIRKQAEVASHATGDSLVLLDEVGSGTDPKEGEALAIALLNDLREKGCMTICTTHYDRLKAYGKRHDDVLLASVQFDLETLSPTYKYVEGLTGASNAFEVAKKYGLPDRIVKYARFLKEQARSEEDVLIDRLEKQLNENHAMQEELSEKLKAAEDKEKQLQKQSAMLEKQRDELKEKAEAEAEKYLEDVRKQAKEILKDMRRKAENAKYHEGLESLSKINALSESLNQKEEELPKDIHYKVGDAVELRSSSTVAQIRKIEKKDIIISVNGREMRVKKNQIRPSTHVIPKQKPVSVVHVQSEDIFAEVPTEVNLIGMRVDEGLDKMALFLDQAKLHHLNSVRIIHGDGTGRLRKAVHAKLSSDPSVKSFRLGMPNEGGTGATIVTLK